MAATAGPLHGVCSLFGQMFGSGTDAAPAAPPPPEVAQYETMQSHEDVEAPERRFINAFEIHQPLTYHEVLWNLEVTPDALTGTTPEEEAKRLWQEASIVSQAWKSDPTVQVQCPICGVTMSNAEMFSHTDVCGQSPANKEQGGQPKRRRGAGGEYFPPPSIVNVDDSSDAPPELAPAAAPAAAPAPTKLPSSTQHQDTDTARMSEDSLENGTSSMRPAVMPPRGTYTEGGSSASGHQRAPPPKVDAVPTEPHLPAHTESGVANPTAEEQVIEKTKQEATFVTQQEPEPQPTPAWLKIDFSQSGAADIPDSQNERTPEMDAGELLKATVQGSLANSLHFVQEAWSRKQREVKEKGDDMQSRFGQKQEQLQQYSRECKPSDSQQQSMRNEARRGFEELLRATTDDCRSLLAACSDAQECRDRAMQSELVMVDGIIAMLASHREEIVNRFKELDNKEKEITQANTDIAEALLPHVENVDEFAKRLDSEVKEEIVKASAVLEEMGQTLAKEEARFVGANLPVDSCPEYGRVLQQKADVQRSMGEQEALLDANEKRMSEWSKVCASMPRPAAVEAAKMKRSWLQAFGGSP